MRVFTLFLLSLTMLCFQCSEDDIERLCIEGPCGTPNQDQFNISILLSSGGELSNVTLMVGNESGAISLTGLDSENGQIRSCWHSTDLRPSPLLASTLTYTLDGETYTAIIDGATITNNLLIVEISGDQVAYYDYVEECNDTPTG